MKPSQNTSGAIPEHFKTLKREEFLSPTNFGTLSGQDLYWLLYRAASDAQDSVSNFYNEVGQLLEERLGAGNYVFGLNVAPGEHGGTIGFDGSALPNNMQWGGDAGVLPGIGRSAGVSCFVFWR
ncbi:hypothetical protein F0U59_39590 [Archangium gephyra]|nr:hypothetical protein F0U59_39590 [Archangium gephyra]